MSEPKFKKYLSKYFIFNKRCIKSLRTSLAGFTLIEVLVSVVILSFLTVCIFAVLNIGDMSWRTDMSILDVIQSLRQAMPGMIRELRQSVNNSTYPINITSGGEVIEFYIYNVSNSIKYYVQGDQIIREHPPGTTRVLATNIVSVDFCCYQGASTCNTNCTNSEVVKIDLSASSTAKLRNTTFTITEKVRLRNE